MQPVDVAPAALAHPGTAAQASRGLDGRATGVFDSLRGELGPAVDEDGIGPSALGVATTPPEGWKPTTRPWAAPAYRMAWLGLHHRRFLDARPGRPVTRTQRPGPERLRRGRPGEWANKGDEQGTFDSTLISPEPGVEGGSTATPRFVPHHRHDPARTAQALVFCDGDTPQIVKSYDADATARRESRRPAVPEGVSRARDSFRCGRQHLVSGARRGTAVRRAGRRQVRGHGGAGHGGVACG